MAEADSRHGQQPDEPGADLSLPLVVALLFFSLLTPFIGPLACLLLGAAYGKRARSTLLMRAGIAILALQFIALAAAVLLAPLYLDNETTPPDIAAETRSVMDALIAAEGEHHRINGRYATLAELREGGLLRAQYADEMWLAERELGVTVAVDQDGQGYDAVVSRGDHVLMATEQGLLTGR